MNNMSGVLESEVRAYNNKLRRQKIVRRQRAVLFVILALFVAAVVMAATTKVLEAHSEVNTTDFKYYTQVEIHSSDTLWGFARDYASPKHYRDYDSYISEVRAINHLEEDQEVIAGNTLILPYYSSEFK